MRASRVVCVLDEEFPRVCKGKLSAATRGESCHLCAMHLLVDCVSPVCEAFESSPLRPSAFEVKFGAGCEPISAVPKPALRIFLSAFPQRK